MDIDLISIRFDKVQVNFDNLYLSWKYLHRELMYDVTEIHLCWALYVMCSWART